MKSLVVWLRILKPSRITNWPNYEKYMQQPTEHCQQSKTEIFTINRKMSEPKLGVKFLFLIFFNYEL